MRYIMMTCLITLKLTCMAQEDWILQAQRIDEEGVEWLKEHLQQRLNSENLNRDPLEASSTINPSKNCQGCGSADVSMEKSSPLYVFMSFSLQDSLWVGISKELEKIGGSFILRGLPQNSFKELAGRIIEMQEKGVSVPIQIHPKLFQEYEIDLVPSIVVVDGNKFDKMSGNSTLEFALEKMARQGETNIAKKLYEQLKEQKRK